MGTSLLLPPVLFPWPWAGVGVVRGGLVRGSITTLPSTHRPMSTCSSAQPLGQCPRTVAREHLLCVSGDSPAPASPHPTPTAGGVALGRDLGPGVSVCAGPGTCLGACVIVGEYVQLTCRCAYSHVQVCVHVVACR